MLKKTPVRGWIEAVENRVLLSAANITDTPASISVARKDIAAAAVGDMAIFAGGTDQAGDASSVVDIYNASTNQWSTSQLSRARGHPVAVSAGTKIFVAGGDLTPEASLDVYDTSSGDWSTAALPVPIIATAACSVDGEAIIVGQSSTSLEADGIAEIYHVASDTWSDIDLGSSIGFGFYGATVGEQAIFMGGRGLEIYDAPTASWHSFDDVNHSLYYSNSAAASGSKFVIWAAGGLLVFDPVTWRLYPQPLDAQGSFYLPGGPAASLGDQAVFPGGDTGFLAPAGTQGPFVTNKIYTFSADTDTVATSTLASARGQEAAVNVGDTILVAGGDVGNSVVNAVDVLTDSSPTPSIVGSVVGQHRKASVVIENAGDATLGGPFNVELFAVAPGHYHGAVLLGSQAVNASLAAGASVRLSVPISISSNSPAGTYHLVAMVKAADGTLTPFAGATQNFTIKSSATAKPAASKSSPAIVRPTFSTVSITGSVGSAWLTDFAADVLE